MDKQLKEQIKHDTFVEQIENIFEYVTTHKAGVLRNGAIVLAVLLVAGSIYGFLNWRKNQRQEDLRKASLVLDGIIGVSGPPGAQMFKTQEEKDTAAMKAFNEVALKHSGSMEGLIARVQASSQLCDMGKTAECESGLKEAANGSHAQIASVAKVSLVSLYHGQKKLAEAEKLCRELIANPTPLVSKEQAQILLVKTIIRSKPQEARSILEQLQNADRSAVTRAAVGLLGELNQISPPK
ncbi:MAG: tetratricopeptide repeat protein [Candidatus Solibacter usitatus]|nr:tetratricopeptide repeat protein [Candidatus Solibacter usitatus]